MSREKAREFFEYVKMMRDTQRKWEVLRDKDFLISKRYWENKVDTIIEQTMRTLEKIENTANNKQ